MLQIVFSRSCLFVLNTKLADVMAALCFVSISGKVYDFLIAC